MRRVILAILIACAVSGCAVRTSSGLILFPQRGVVLQLSHSCTDRALVYQAGSGLIREVVGVTPVDMGLQPVVLGEREITVMVQSVNSAGKVSATYTQSFQIDGYSTTTQSWIIGNSGGYGGGGYTRHSQCQQ